MVDVNKRFFVTQKHSWSRGGKAQSVGHMSASGGRRRTTGLAAIIKPQTSQANATAATGMDTLRNGGSSGTDDIGMMTIEPQSSILDRAQSYYHSKLTSQQAKSMAHTKKVGANEDRNPSPKAVTTAKIKLRSAGHNLFRPPANKPVFTKSKLSPDVKSQVSPGASKTIKTAASYRLTKQTVSSKPTISPSK